MAENNLSQLLEGMADAIREKDGTTQKISPQDFAERIMELPMGLSDIQIIQFTIASNDLYNLNFEDYGDGIGDGMYIFPMIDMVDLAGTITLYLYGNVYASRSIDINISEEKAYPLIRIYRQQAISRETKAYITNMSTTDPKIYSISTENAQYAQIEYSGSSSENATFYGFYIPLKYLST